MLGVQTVLVQNFNVIKNNSLRAKGTTTHDIKYRSHKLLQTARL
jgi:hypothetical protein